MPVRKRETGSTSIHALDTRLMGRNRKWMLYKRKPCELFRWYLEWLGFMHNFPFFLNFHIFLHSSQVTMNNDRRSRPTISRNGRSWIVFNVAVTIDTCSLPNKLLYAQTLTNNVQQQLSLMNSCLYGRQNNATEKQVRDEWRLVRWVHT